MPKPLALRLLLKALQNHGFFFISQRGSHAKYRKGSSTVIVPLHGKDIPHGTLRSILRQAKITEEDIRSKNRPCL